MPDIPDIKIGDIFLPKTNILQIKSSNILPPTVPVTLQIGSPIIEVPGCVKYNPANKKSQKLLEEDDQNIILCDGSTPSFEPLNYEPENLIYVKPEPVPVVPPPPDTGSTTPPLNEIPKIPNQETVPCPGPNDLRVGDIRNGEAREIVVSHSLSSDGKTCITNYEPTTPIQKYIPSVSQLSTTATIAVVATASAALATPLLRLIKPLIKQLIKKIQKLSGKKEKKLFSTTAHLKKSKILTKVRAHDSE
tara:strand:- start:393 stop:1136 length:744 start_codon:yes stop_codon:yes gene_type:complete